MLDFVLWSVSYVRCAASVRASSAVQAIFLRSTLCRSGAWILSVTAKGTHMTLCLNVWASMYMNPLPGHVKKTSERDAGMYLVRGVPDCSDYKTKARITSADGRVGRRGRTSRICSVARDVLDFKPGQNRPRRWLAAADTVLEGRANRALTPPPC